MIIRIPLIEKNVPRYQNLKIICPLPEGRIQTCHINLIPISILATCIERLYNLIYHSSNLKP